MERRNCAACGERKSIAGVWYLMADGPGTFVCGTCFHDEAAGLARQSVRADL